MGGPDKPGHDVLQQFQSYDYAFTLAPRAGGGELLDEVEAGLVEGGAGVDAVGAELQDRVGGRRRRPARPGRRRAGSDGLGEGGPVRRSWRR